MARATDISTSTINRGLKELQTRARLAPGRVRRPGGGRKRTIDKDPTVLRDLESLVEPTTSGDPQSPLGLTAKSVRGWRGGCKAWGRISHRLVAELLTAAGYSLRANRKTREGPLHPDRDAQFHHITARVRHFQAAGQPVISVDTKKKELLGDFKNAGQTWRPTGQPHPVRVDDFLIPEQGKAIPYGVYDLTRKPGWVSVGIDHDTASFTVRTIGRWWQKMGRPRYRRARALLITPMPGAAMGRASGSGGNSSSWPIVLVWRSRPVTSRPEQQVEHHRASALFLHQPQLSGPAPGQSGGDRQPDRGHPHRHRAARALRAGSWRVPQGPHGHG